MFRNETFPFWVNLQFSLSSAVKQILIMPAKRVSGEVGHVYIPTDLCFANLPASCMSSYLLLMFSDQNKMQRNFKSTQARST